MAAPETKGRMLNQDISESKKFAKLSAPAAVLFCMIIPHLNSYGKLKGGVGFIKDEVCPLTPYITERKLPRLLQEIDANTNVKWFKWEGRYWIHSINFLTEHQNLRTERMGEDKLPDYSWTNSRTTPGPSPARAGEVEVEEKKKGEGKSGSNPPKILKGFKPKTGSISEAQRKYNFSYATVATETEKFIMHRRASGKEPADPQADWELWMLRQFERVGGSAGKEKYEADKAARDERQKAQEAEEARIESEKLNPEETLAAIRAIKNRKRQREDEVVI